MSDPANKPPPNHAPGLAAPGAAGAAAHPTPPSPEKQLEGVVGHWVQYGTLALATLGLLGLAVFLWRHGGAPISFEALGYYHSEPRDLRSLRGIFGDAETFSGRGLGQLAVALLLLVPVARVAACVEIFRCGRDFLHVKLSLVVLGILLFSLLLER